MTTRVCEWCGGPLKPDAKPSKVVCSEAHRALRWRWLNGVPRSGGRGPQSPPRESPLWARPVAPGARPVAPVRTAPKRRKPSGLQLSYWKAVEALEDHLIATFRLRSEAAREEAAFVLRQALSEKQRARLDERGQS